MTGDPVTGTVRVEEVDGSRAPEVVGVIRAGFGARPPLDPPSTATEETPDSVAAALDTHGGLLAVMDSRPVGTMIFEPHGVLLGMRRVAVHPDAQGMGVAGGMVGAAERIAAERGYDGLRVAARTELPETITRWRHLGYQEVSRAGSTVTLAKAVPVERTARTAEEARDLGVRLAKVLRPGDLVILTGDLGAGKTTFAQGLGAGLEVRGEVTSPTFVISRVHPSTVGGPPLVHVDAYRLGGVAELDDLDLDASLDDAVTVVEWGEGVAEGLSEDRLEVDILRSRGGAGSLVDTDVRHLRFAPVGARWIEAGLAGALA